MGWKNRGEERKWYWINRKRILEYKKQWRKNNPEKVLEYGRKKFKNNREKVLERNRKWYKNNPEKVKQMNKIKIERLKKDPERARINRLRDRYKITNIDYENMLNMQSGICAICGGVDKNNKRLHIDHDHTTYKFRALLCGSCNRVLGIVHEDAYILSRMIDYLNYHKRR